MLESEHYEAAESAILQVVGWYAKRYYWADSTELEQEAWLACLRARATFKPELGEPRGFYYNAAKYALRPYLWKQRSVLSAPSTELAALFTARADSLDDTVAPKLANGDPDPGLEIDRMRWRTAIRSRIGAILDSLDGGKLARACLVQEQKAKAVAAAFDVPVSAVYDATRKAKHAVANDSELFNLWRRDERNEN